MEFAIEDCGVDHCQYFPGISTAYTQWSSRYLGNGDTLRDAIEDAFEDFAQNEDTALVNEVRDFYELNNAGFTEEELDKPVHDENDECSKNNDDCEHYHYVVIFV